ncbi:MAG: DeoR/GlpR family DNA-binding transcription regulator [Nitrososphaerales archaeon]
MTAFSGAAKRRETIIEQLARENVVRVAELSQTFGISEVSIRRDLERLQRNGLLQRVHGGAVAVVTADGARAGDHAHGVIQHLEEKRRIGRAGAALIEPGDRILFDSGTTVLEVARALTNDPVRAGSLTAITCSLPIVQELGHHRWIHLLLLGGIYLAERRLVIGPQTIETLRTLHADKMFLGADGMTLSHGVTTATVLEAEVDRAMIQAADEVILVADSSKVGGIGLATILPLARVHKLITDQAASASFVKALADAGVEVVLV